MAGGSRSEADDLEAAIAILVGEHERNTAHEDEFVNAVEDQKRVGKRAIRDRIKVAHERRKRARAERQAAQTDRPIVRYRAADLEKHKDEVIGHLTAGSTRVEAGPTFHYGEALCIVLLGKPRKVQQRLRSGELDAYPPMPMTRRLTPHSLREKLMRTCRFAVQDKDGVLHPIAADMQLVHMVLEGKGHGFSVLTGIAESPLVLPDGRLIQERVRRAQLRGQGAGRPDPP